MNVGATQVSDHGGYFAWGETGNKDDYSWSTYKHGTSADDLSKYSYTDHAIALQAADDAAHMNWGGEWRMPTGTEWGELCDRCNCHGSGQAWMERRDIKSQAKRRAIQVRVFFFRLADTTAAVR